MNDTTFRSASLGGAVTAALVASACCIGPLVFALLGIGGAGLLVKLEPYRPLLTGVTLALLGAGFWLTYRKRAPAGTCATGVCEAPRTGRAGRTALWIATVVVLVALGFPYLTPYIF